MASTKQETRKSVREEFAEKFISILESNKPLEWMQGWANTCMTRPYNGGSNRHYNGVNRFILGFAALEKGWTDPRFYTFKQASDGGYSIKKGEKSTRVEYWAVWDSEKKKSISISEYTKIPKSDLEDDRFHFYSKSAYVFNAAQIEGMELLPAPAQQSQFQENSLAEAVLDCLSTNMNVPIHYGGDRAYYSPDGDYVQMPQREVFFTAEDYYSTLGHELSHATGAASRLNRPMDSLYANSESYALEELRAEIASTYFCAELGVSISEKAMENHQAYVASWLKAIKEDHNALFAALKDADKIADYMMEQGRVELMKEEVMREALLPGILEKGTTYEIWQLRDDPANRSIAFLPYDYASQFRLTDSRYEKRYEAPVTEQDNSLDKIFCKFNIDCPEDFQGHSLSVSDIIVTVKDEKKQAYYCDSYGFQPVQGFFTQRNQSAQRGHGR